MKQFNFTVYPFILYYLYLLYISFHPSFYKCFAVLFQTKVISKDETPTNALKLLYVASGPKLFSSTRFDHFARSILYRSPQAVHYFAPCKNRSLNALFCFLCRNDATKQASRVGVNGRGIRLPFKTIFLLSRPMNSLLSLFHDVLSEVCETADRYR